jgi:anti-anti-sigma regulatory factor
VTSYDLTETPALERDVGGRRRLAPQELRVEIVAAALFVVVAGVMLAASGGWDEPLSAVLLTATYAVVDRVSFLLGPGYVSPTQLVFVPMLFLLPPEAVPALVAAGSLLGALPEIALGRVHPERALFAFAGSWYAVGPAVVFALFDPGAPSWADTGVYALALLAQFGTDFVASTLRERLGSGIPPRELAPVLGVVYLVDVLLSPIGFMAVLASEDHPYAYLLAVPPGGLLALIAHERRRRLEHELSLGRAYRRSTRMLDDQAEELRRARLRVGEAMASTLDRAGLERLLLNTTVEAVEADAGRLSQRADDGTLVERLATGDPQRFGEALSAAEVALSVVPARNGQGEETALAIPLVSQIVGDDRGREQVLAVARAGRPFSPAEQDLLEHLAAHVRVSLDNLRLRELEQAAAEAVRELSTPVLVALERLLIVPLVGALDADRAQQLTDELLQRIRRGRAQVVVIDVTGVPAIDPEVAAHLVETVAACGLLGARVILTGLSSDTTQALVASGVDLKGIHAVADLQRAIEEAQRLL